VWPLLGNAFAALVLGAKNAPSLQISFYPPLKSIDVVVTVYTVGVKHVLSGSLISKEEKWSLYTFQG
jgi:hypothetical protein